MVIGNSRPGWLECAGDKLHSILNYQADFISTVMFTYVAGISTECKSNFAVFFSCRQERETKLTLPLNFINIFYQSSLQCRSGADD